MDISEIIRSIESVAHPDLQASWDQSGIQIISAKKEFSSLGVFLDPTPGAVEEALKSGADFLLSHHPLSLKPDLPNKDNNYTEVIRMVMGASAMLYAAHTSLDVNLTGPSGWLGRGLMLKDTKPLEEIPQYPGHRSFGYGEVGNLPECEPLQKLIERIMLMCGISWARITRYDPEAACERIAYCGGSGKSLINAVEKAKADLYITGDMDHHAALDSAIPILDVGHHSMEEEMMRRFASDLEQKLAGLKVIFFPSRPPFQPIGPDGIQK